MFDKADEILRRAGDGEDVSGLVQELPAEDQSQLQQVLDDLEAVIGPRIPLGALRGKSAGWAGDLIGRELGGFLIRSEVGRGGMGAVVFEATEVSAQKRRVALKILPPSYGADPRARDRFRREAKALETLDHPGICPVYGSGESEAYLFIAMRFVDGQRLDRWFEERNRDRAAMSVRDAAAVALACAEALAHAHERGIVHRDVKPSNILVNREGVPVIVDFGLARGSEDATVTLTTERPGTPLFMSPQQIDSRRWGPVDARTDIYSLGVTVYAMLARRPPFEASTPNAVREDVHRAILSKDATWLGAVNRRVPRTLQVIVHKAMEKKLGRRYQTAGALADDLRAFLDGAPITARAPGVVRRAWRLSRRHPRMVSAAALVIVAILAVSGRSVWRESKGRTALAEARTTIRAAMDRLPRLEDERWWALKEDVEASQSWQPDGKRDERLKRQHDIREREHVIKDAIDRASDDLRVATESLWSASDVSEPQRQLLELQRSFLEGSRRTAGPQVLTAASSPPGASVYVFRYQNIKRAEDGLEYLVPIPLQRSRSSSAIETRSSQSASASSAYPLLATDHNLLGKTGSDRLAVTLDPGSYLLLFRKEGFEDLRYPVLVEGAAIDVTSSDARLWSAAEASTLPGFINIPAGYFWQGVRFPAERQAFGAVPNQPNESPLHQFFIARHEVTCAEYAKFLNSEYTLAKVDKNLGKLKKALDDRDMTGLETAMIRVPRSIARPFGLWERMDGRYLIPAGEDRLPVRGASFDDALAYCGWRTETENSGWRYRLPTVVEWEKAARGVDGRSFPWGDAFVGEFCCTMLSPGSFKAPVPVGSLPPDESPYGVRDLAGNVSEWIDPLGKGDWAYCRGGSWSSNSLLGEIMCVARPSRKRVFANDTLGFRLVAERSSDRMPR